MTISDTMTQADVQEVQHRLDQFNEAIVPLEAPYHQPLQLALRDHSGHLRGALIGFMHGWKVLFIDILWVDIELRQTNYGTTLLQQAEKWAKAKGCHMIQLDTFDFQAPGFYSKQGYDCFAVVEGFPKDHKRFYFKKQL